LDENKLKTVSHQLNNCVEFTPNRRCQQVTYFRMSA